MKNIFKYVLITIVVAIIGGVIWWQYNKKSIVKTQITKAVANGTDSTYYIKYDSSNINAAAGNAVFYNLVLQSDTLQQQLYENDTAGIAKTIFNVRIEQLAISGANIPSFLQKNTIEANSIEIIKPVITIISTGKNELVKFTAADTLALYEKLTGKFKSIKAKQIKITEGTIAFAKGKQSPHSTLMGVNIILNNLQIDSTKNYDNIVSYLIKDVVASVKTANTVNKITDKKMLFEGIEYNAPKRSITVKKVMQTQVSNNKNLLLLNNNKITGLSTAAFILNKTIKADSLTTDGGSLTITRKPNKNKDGQSLEIDNAFFDDAIVKNIRIGSTTLTVNNTEKNKAPLTLKNIRFTANNIDSIYSGTDLLFLLNKSKWQLSADAFTFVTADKVYNVNVGPFSLDNTKKTITINQASIKPLLTEAAFVQSLKFQADLFNIDLKNLQFTGADFNALLQKNNLVADGLSLEPVLRVFNDRLVTPDTSSKVGKYPNQLIAKLELPIYIKTVTVKNGLISYRERGALSKNIGDVFFNKVNGTVNNVTNMPLYLKNNPNMTVNVNAMFLGIATLKSTWTMPLKTGNSTFKITGSVGSFDGLKLNPVIEPLGMGSVKSGVIDKYDFEMNGDDYKTNGSGLFLYHDLKITLLKSKDDNIKNKDVTSFLANIFIKDKNPSNSKTRKASISFNRVITKSFFNLVWKSIFDGAKSSIK